MTKVTSIRDLLKEGTLKRADAIKAALKDLHIEPGFNLRFDGPELQEHRAAMLAHLLAGGTFPPIEVRIADDGTIKVVDGHNRHWVYTEAERLGHEIGMLDLVLFKGNDLDRVAKIITAASGKALTPLEIAIGYKRLTAFKQTPDQIAARFSKTRQHVDQLLILAGANHDVHELVAAGKVSAALAVSTVRAHGEGAGEFLRKQLDKSSKGKVTPGTIKGKPLPPKVVAGLVDEVAAFKGALPRDAMVRLAGIEKAAKDGVIPEDQMVSVPAAALLALLNEQNKIDEARKAQKLAAKKKADRAAQQELPE